MLVTVLKPLPYAPDHMNVVLHPEGAQIEVHDDLVEGLEAEGFISAEPPPPAAAEAVEIPADWTSLTWFKLQALAGKIAGAKPANKPAAVAVIEAEVARRAAA